MKTLIPIAVVVFIAYFLIRERMQKRDADQFNSMQDGGGDTPYDPQVGCTDVTACNYSPSAEIDDGKCVYATGALDCDGFLASDLNQDGTVTTSDLLIILGAFGTSCPSGDCPSDINEDGTISVADLLLFLGEFGMDNQQANEWIQNHLNCDYSKNFCMV